MGFEDILKSINANKRFVYADDWCYTENNVNDLVPRLTGSRGEGNISEIIRVLLEYSDKKGYSTYRFSRVNNIDNAIISKGIDVGANIVYGKLRRKRLRHDADCEESRADKIVAWGSGISIGGITGVMGYTAMDIGLVSGAAIAAKAILLILLIQAEILSLTYLTVFLTGISVLHPWLPGALLSQQQ